jgi:5-hydroxyisourate hydrolase-like protein (transthyretin family)
MRCAASELMRRTWLPTVLLLLAAVVALPSGLASAGTYEVRACDAASTVSPVNNSWVLSASPGFGAQALCPSDGSNQRGITTRIIATVGAGNFERATFYAPAGNTILGVRWAGRYARNSCSWAAEIRARPVEKTIIGSRENTNCATSNFELTNPYFVSAPAGTTSLMQNVQCGAGSCPSGATFNTYHAAVLVQDPTIPSVGATGGGPTTNRWLRGEQTVSFSASDNSGVSRVEARVDGVVTDNQAWLCDPTRPVPCGNHVGTLAVPTTLRPDGPHTLRLTATDASGNTHSSDRTFKTDNTAPERVSPAVVGGQGWRRSNGFSIRWANPPQNFAPITKVHYRLCSAGGSCVDGVRAGSNVESIGSLAAQKLGDSTLRVWLEDEAGNQSIALASEPVHLRLDPEAPRLSFLKQDPADPLTVAVRATDAYSGIASGEIEMRRAGGRTWNTLDTHLDGKTLKADIDDEHFGTGTYEFRAHATDRAGNETTAGVGTDGARAAIHLPVRIPTGLRVGFPKTKVKRVVLRRHGRRKVLRRRVTVLRRSARVGLGRRTRVLGSLANPDGQPIDGVTVAVLAKRAVPGAHYSTVGLVTTDRNGRFSYRMKAKQSRSMRFRYAGSRRIRGATRTVKLLVPGAASIAASRSRLLNGQGVVFAGRVRTRPLPRAGKLIEVQAFFRGKWRTISTTRSDALGRWRFPYRFGGTIGLVRYRFRVRLPAEGGYPFATGASRAVTVTVRGL